MRMAMDGVNVEAAKPSARVISGARRWIATAAASFVTAYALDLFATCLGLLLVASELLSGIGHVEALLLLIASYVFWGSGLWAVRKATWALRQRTGPAPIFSPRPAMLSLRAWVGACAGARSPP